MIATQLYADSPPPPPKKKTWTHGARMKFTELCHSVHLTYYEESIGISIFSQRLYSQKVWIRSLWGYKR